jgi:transcriptional regulator GlxA family with amidase domain
MMRATRLLAQDDEQIAQIACAVGFINDGQFGRDFRRLFGLTPPYFRRALRFTSPSWIDPHDRLA